MSFDHKSPVMFRLRWFVPPWTVWGGTRWPLVIYTQCYYQSSRAFLSLSTRRFTYSWSSDAINSFTEALATILSNCLYKSHLTIFFGLEWDSNPGPLADGTYRVAYTLGHWHTNHATGRETKISFPSLISWSVTRIYTQMLLPEQ